MKKIIPAFIIGFVLASGSIVYAARTQLFVDGGGTGQGTFTASQLLYGNGTNALSSVATSSVTCSSGASCTAFDRVGSGGSTITTTLGTSVDLASEITGTLPIANGGTNGTTFSLNSLVYFNGTSLVSTSSLPLFVGSLTATSTTATTTILNKFSMGSSSPQTNCFFCVGSSSPIIQVNNNGYLGFFGNNTGPARLTIGPGTNANVNPNVYMLIQDTSDARFGASAADSGIFMKSSGGVYAYNYALGSAKALALQEFGSCVVMGTTACLASEKMYILGADNGIAQAIRVNAASASVTTADTFIDFSSTDGSIGSIAGTAVSGVIAFNTFTGSHFSKIDITSLGSLLWKIKTGNDYGYLVEANGVINQDIGKGYLSGSQMACTKGSKAVYGVYGGTDKDDNDTVLSIGTGKMWVVNKGENLDVGDLLMASDECGMAEKQKSDWLGFDESIISNKTAGKIMEPIEWKRGEKYREVGVVYLGG